MAETFGNTNKEANDYNPGWANCLGCKYQSGSAGQLVSISVYIKYRYDNSYLKCAIYDSSFNKLPNGETEAKQIEGGQDGWIVFNFGTPPSVEASTDYWLVIWNDTSYRVYWKTGSTNQTGYKGYTYNGWPDLISFDSWLAYELSMFATYEEAPPPAKKTLVQAALISIPPLIVLPTLGQILKLTGGC